jgi:hypothetical protein
VKEGGHLWSFARGGAHLSIVRTITWREALLRGGCMTKGKAKARQSSKAQAKSKSKARGKERGQGIS